ncbi:MAG TPA: hypothetical protein PK184_08900 [Phycisphaerae bacterium]|jgi:hypothetical protein|nr:hypothetical protein [Phycisphaerae bacterium]
MMMLLSTLFLVSQTLSSTAVAAPATQPARWDTRPDTWTATDALGRTLIDHEQAGPPRPDKFVGIFYFLWLGQHGTDGPYDITKILAQEPDALRNPSSPLWGPQHKYHFWAEPLFGYYLSDDAWVLQKHAQMLADAGIDVIIFDVTNQVTYQKVYMRLCEVFSDLRRQGRRTPQIAFLTPFWDPAKVTSELYENLYKPGRYRELWFHWKGKPLILADPAKVTPEQRDFFTFRKPQPDYFQGPTGPDQWGWLEIHPQHAFYNQEGKPEQVTVGVGQNATGKRLCAFSEKNTYGRSWHNGKKDERPDAVLHGLNFAEQWEHALKIDPEFIFITGWNEWIAMRLPEFNRVREPVMFVDQFTQEYSRDAEPMRGGHGDNYYFQMINNIRRFKGVRPASEAGPARTIRIDGDFADWRDVRPEFRDDPGDTVHRDHPGYDKAGHYTNKTGRNDFVLLKVAYDRDWIYFYARTARPITPSSDRHWMMLFIDADANPKTGWEGYDFLVNRIVKDDRNTTLEATKHGWNWQAQAEVPYRVSGNELELAIPRNVLAPAGSAERPRLNFKWADNMQTEGDIMEFTVNGDAAPNSRFCYVVR